MSVQWSGWQSRWWRAALVSGWSALALCAFGMAQGFVGLDVGETCIFGEGQDFDLEYWAAHHHDSPLPPYSTPCNAGYDMVPGWVNPAIAVTAASCAVSLVGLVVARRARWARARR